MIGPRKVDLHELICMDGFGSAKKVLRERGHWREIDEETGYPIWEVILIREVEASVIVAAPDQHSAKEFALDAYMRREISPDFDTYGCHTYADRAGSVTRNFVTLDVRAPKEE